MTDPPPPPSSQDLPSIPQPAPRPPPERKSKERLKRAVLWAVSLLWLAFIVFFLLQSRNLARNLDQAHRRQQALTKEYSFLGTRVEAFQERYAQLLEEKKLLEGERDQWVKERQDLVQQVKRLTRENRLFLMEQQAKRGN